MANKLCDTVQRQITKHQGWMSSIFVISKMLEHVHECDRELCSWWSPIPRKQNSELRLNMVLVFSDSIKGVQTLEGKIWIVLQVVGLC